MSENTEAPAVEQTSPVTMSEIRARRFQARREGGTWMSTAELQTAVYANGYDTYGAWNNWNAMNKKRLTGQYYDGTIKVAGFLSLVSFYQCSRLASLSGTGKTAALVGATVLPLMFVSHGFNKRLQLFGLA